MNEGMTWHDGEPVTAEDAAFTYNFIIENEIAAYVSFVAGINRVEAIDDLTYKVICDRPVANMLTLWIPCLPEHIWGEMRAKEAGQNLQTIRPASATAPTRSSSGRRSASFRMEAYDDFYLGKPTVDELIFVVYQNGDTMVQDLKAGTLDAAYLFPPAQFEPLAGDRGRRGHRVQLVQLGLRRVQLLRGRVQGPPGPAGQGLPGGPGMGGRPRKDGRAGLRRPCVARLHVHAAGQLE